MKPFAQFPEKRKKKVRYVLTDIDDTLTNNGRLPAVAYHAMERLQDAGISVIPPFTFTMTINGKKCCDVTGSLRPSEWKTDESLMKSSITYWENFPIAGLHRIRTIGKRIWPSIIVRMFLLSPWKK
jgi:hypothetical protein